MFIRGQLLSSVMAGPVHTVFTSSPLFTYWLSVVVQVSVRGVPAEREPLLLAETITNGEGTGEEKPSHELAGIKLITILTLNSDILTGVATETCDMYRLYVNDGSAGVLSSMEGLEGAELQVNGGFSATSAYIDNSNIIHTAHDCTASRDHPLNFWLDSKTLHNNHSASQCEHLSCCG